MEANCFGLKIGTRTKVTSNVRRILQSQKTFRNYLDDEEAALAQATSTSTTTQRVPLNKIAKPSSGSLSRRSSTPATTPKPDTSASRAKKDTSKKRSEKTPIEPESTPQTLTEQDRKDHQDQDQDQDQGAHLIKSQYDNDPLLKSYIPSAPSERIMRALLSEPPLTYNASRAGPPLTGKSTRKFCCICGYWGKIRCRNCHQRTCGGDCYKTHEDSRCGAFF